MSGESQKSPVLIIVAIIGASATCIAAIIGLGQPVVSRWVDMNFPLPTSTTIALVQVQATQTTNPQPTATFIATTPTPLLETPTQEVTQIIPTQKPTVTALPLPTTIIPPSPTISLCPSAGHLGKGKGFSVTLIKGCHYHFNIACSGCGAGVENNYIIYYNGDSGDMVAVTVPEGSVWQYSRQPTTGEVCETQDYYPTSLPSFLSVSGVQLLRICG